tara:strand:+ start:844 stop:1242 length:399 start_codon:yes stop_codon:yes gene_type:complete
MNFSAPDSVSSNDLQKYINKIKTSNESNEEYTYDELTEEELVKLIDDFSIKLFRQCRDPLIFKLLVLRSLADLEKLSGEIACSTLTEYQKTSEEYFLKRAFIWMNATSKFAACQDLIHSISLGPDDFTYLKK